MYQTIQFHNKWIKQALELKGEMYVLKLPKVISYKTQDIKTKK